jgi:hypothetical integral membrane protein (TIGR02206 family)
MLNSLLSPGIFTLFGTTHLAVIVFIIISSLFVYLSRNNQILSPYLKWIIVSTLFFQVVLFNGWHLYYGTFNPIYHLPFHLCSISIYLVAFSLLFPRASLLHQITFFLSPISALLAVLFPDIGAQENFPTFRFIEFFLSHSFIIIGAVYLMSHYKPTISYKAVWTSFAILFVYMLLCFPINQISGGNYLYLDHKPTGGGPFDLFPAEPYHIYALIPFVLGVFHVEYGATKIAAVISQSLDKMKKVS